MDIDIIFKIAAIEHRSVFKHQIDSRNYSGLELGADVYSCNLDDFMVFSNNQAQALTFFRELLYQHINSMLSDDEKYILDRKVELSRRKSISDYIRTLILYGFVYDVDYSYLRQYNETLGKISGSLNQIAKRINSTGNVYEEDMKEVKGIMDEVWRTQKAMLKK